jgi:large subunit ribosomal protein L17
VRHRKARTKLNRSPAHRKAMMNNMLLALIEHGRIKTTERRAKELRRMAERAISTATRLGDVLVKEPSELDADQKARKIHAMRLVGRVVKQRPALLKLFEEWAPLYLSRPGGYTRTYKLGNRRGDNAPMVLIEFVDAPRASGGDDEQPEESGERKKGLLARLRGK